MDKMTLINRLKSKPDLPLLVREAQTDADLLGSLLEIAATDKSSAKFVCTKVIRLLSEEDPVGVYPYFERIAGWLKHSNSFVIWDAILILSNLASVDHANRFEEIFDDYFGLIRAPQMITAGNVVGSAWKVVLAKPELEAEITRRLLEVPHIIYIHRGEPSPECNRILCGKVMECFERYFGHSGSQRLMIDFAEKQLGSSRKAVAKTAERFLKSHGNRSMQQHEGL